MVTTNLPLSLSPQQVTGSHDHSIRLWERTDEPLILSEERENEREAEFEEAAVKDSEQVVSVCVRGQGARVCGREGNFSHCWFNVDPW